MARCEGYGNPAFSGRTAGIGKQALLDNVHRLGVVSDGDIPEVPNAYRAIPEDNFKVSRREIGIWLPAIVSRFISSFSIVMRFLGISIFKM
jgi:hypothetical protein